MMVLIVCLTAEAYTHGLIVLCMVVVMQHGCTGIRWRLGLGPVVVGSQPHARGSSAHGALGEVGRLPWRWCMGTWRLGA